MDMGMGRAIKTQSSRDRQKSPVAIVDSKAGAGDACLQVSAELASYLHKFRGRNFAASSILDNGFGVYIEQSSRLAATQPLQPFGARSANTSSKSKDLA